MEVLFSSRDGTKTKPVFTQELKALTISTKRSSYRPDGSSAEANIKDSIQLEFQGVDWQVPQFNPRFLESNLTAIYRNVNRANFNDFEEFEKNNARRREQHEMLQQMRRYDQMESSKRMNNGASNQVHQLQPQSPVVQFMNMTGLERAKAEIYLRNSKNNIGEAFDAFERHTKAVEEFARVNQIGRGKAAALMEVANYDKEFALTLLRDQPN